MLQIQKQNEYAMFDLLNINRKIRPRKVDWMVVSISIIDLGNEYPIITTPSKRGIYYIWDGQHRFTARKKLGLPIYFIPTAKMNIKSVARLNMCQDKWNMHDVRDSFSTQDVHEYKVFKGYQEKYGFSVSTTLMVLTGARWGKAREDFLSCDLKITNSISVANQFGEAVGDFSKHIEHNKHRDFVHAFKKLFDHPDYDHVTMMNKMEYLSRKMGKCADTATYLKQFEEVYNYNNRSPLRLV